MAKIIIVDSFDRYNVSDRLFCSALSGKDAQDIADNMNAREHEDSPDFYEVVPDDYVLYVYDPE